MLRALHTHIIVYIVEVDIKTSIMSGNHHTTHNSDIIIDVYKLRAVIFCHLSALNYMSIHACVLRIIFLGIDSQLSHIYVPCTCTCSHTLHVGNSIFHVLLCQH